MTKAWYNGVNILSKKDEICRNASKRYEVIEAVVGGKCQAKETRSGSESEKFILQDLIPEKMGRPFSRALNTWVYSIQAKLVYSRTDTTIDNAYIESFNGSFWDNCLNNNWVMYLLF